MNARVHVIISGSVQGVFFRAETRNMALTLGVKGWVKNRNDGKVEALFEGEKDILCQMVDFCARGPTGAHVEDVDVEWEKFKNEFSSFEIAW